MLDLLDYPLSYHPCYKLHSKCMGCQFNVALKGYKVNLIEKVKKKITDLNLFTNKKIKD